MENEKTDGRAHVLTVEDWGGWKCRLERWFSEYEDEWFTGATVYDAEGNEALHAGMTSHEMTVETALAEIGAARGLLPALSRFAEEGDGDGD